MATWEQHNRGRLESGVSRIRSYLQAAVDGSADADPSEPEPLDRETPSALELIVDSFGLGSFARDCLLLAAAVELDTETAQLVQALTERGDCQPTFGLALSAFPDADWGAMTPRAPLRRWRLVELIDERSLTRSPLRIDERILHFLNGVDYLDERLQSCARGVQPPERPTNAAKSLAEDIREVLVQPSSSEAWPVIQLAGRRAATRRRTASVAADMLDFDLFAVDAAGLPQSSAARDELALRWGRELLLSGRVPMITLEEPEPATRKRARAFIEALSTPTFVSSGQPLRPGRRRAVRFEVNGPSPAEQRSLWKTSLGPLADRLDDDIDRLVGQFDLDAESIRSASSDLQRTVDDGDEVEGRDLGDVLWRSCVRTRRPRLEELAHRIEPRADWQDLILEADRKETLRTIAAHVRRRMTVYRDWGFAEKSSRGLGISAIFTGPSGTGKTMAAEVLAHELSLDLYRIDLSSVVSKYIGETEKNLRRIFETAEGAGAILLFDEADALFGQRSEVTDSRDRYANIEVSYLLQRMEAFAGLAILTTNFRDAIDEAFLRRIRFFVEFPFPDSEQRAEIWNAVFPEDVPMDHLDVAQLARLNVAGGNIRNIALDAAFRAADAGEAVDMRHLLEATRAEYDKLDKRLKGSDVRGWVESESRAAGGGA